jgi:hypothetical protein
MLKPVPGIPLFLTANLLDIVILLPLDTIAH